MINLFRRIRKKLFKENRFTKYLLYAVGEIILVMIGILLALQVNNWNEKRKSLSLKNAYCEQLIASLSSDRTALVEFQKRLNALDREGMYLWDYVNGTKKEIDTNLFKNYFLNAANAFDFTPKSTAYDNIVSSNGLNLIRSDSLKTMLAIYFIPQKGEEEVSQQRIEYAAAYNNSRFEFASPMMLKKYLRVMMDDNVARSASKMGKQAWELEMAIEVDLSEFVLDWKALKQSEDYKIYLGRMLAVREPQLNTNERKVIMIETLIELLKQEIR